MISHLARRLREVFGRRQLDRDLDAELQAHVDLQIERLMRAGAPRAEATRQALAELGSPRLAREQVDAERTGASIGLLADDIVRAARVLRNAPVFSFVAVITMAAGVGATTLLFALVNGIVLAPLPYPQPERLVRIFDVHVPSGGARSGVASGNLNDWRERATAFEGIAGTYVTGRTVGGDQGAPAAVHLTAQVTDDFFHVVGAAPIAGRTFTRDEFQRAEFNSTAMPVGPDPVAVISHRFWVTRFARDPGIVYRTVAIDRRPFRIVGVMPATFAVPGPGVDIWIPRNFGAVRTRDQHYLIAIARTAPGVTLDQASAELGGVAAALGREYPATNRGWTVSLVPLAEDLLGEAPELLWPMFGAVGLVLIVACASVASVVLARGLERRAETIVRLTLGASRGRIVREFLLETTVLSLLGGAIGLVAARAGLSALTLMTTSLPRFTEVAIDLRVTAFAVVVAALGGVAVGIPQALRAARLSPIAGMSGGLRIAGDRNRHRWSDALVVAEVAMAVILVAGAGLFVRSVQHLRAVDPGFSAAGVVVAPVFLDSQVYGDGRKVRAYFDRLFERLSALPGVTAAGGGTAVPVGRVGPDFDRPIWPEHASGDSNARTSASVRVVTPGYFAALGIPVIDGRTIAEVDAPGGMRAVVINDTLARRIWPAGGAVGQRLVIDHGRDGVEPHEVIGVVGDVRFGGPRSAPKPEIYLPHAQRPYLTLNVIVRTAGSVDALIPAVRATLRDLDPEKPAQSVTPLSELLGATYARDSQTMVVLSIFGAAAVLLAFVNVYGALAQRVRERRREIGIRLALGAGSVRVSTAIAGAGLRLVGMGIVVGLFLEQLMAGAIDGLLFGVRPADPPTLLIVVVALASIGLTASLVPAWRATRVDPSQTLRRG